MERSSFTISKPDNKQITANSLVSALQRNDVKAVLRHTASLVSNHFRQVTSIALQREVLKEFTPLLYDVGTFFADSERCLVPLSALFTAAQHHAEVQPRLYVMACVLKAAGLAKDPSTVEYFTDLEYLALGLQNCVLGLVFREFLSNIILSFEIPLEDSEKALTRNWEELINLAWRYKYYYPKALWKDVTDIVQNVLRGLLLSTLDVRACFPHTIIEKIWGIIQKHPSLASSVIQVIVLEIPENLLIPRLPWIFHNLVTVCPDSALSTALCGLILKLIRGIAARSDTVSLSLARTCFISNGLTYASEYDKPALRNLLLQFDNIKPTLNITKAKERNEILTTEEQSSISSPKNIKSSETVEEIDQPCVDEADGIVEKETNLLSELTSLSDVDWDKRNTDDINELWNSVNKEGIVLQKVNLFLKQSKFFETLSISIGNSDAWVNIASGQQLCDSACEDIISSIFVSAKVSLQIKPKITDDVSLCDKLLVIFHALHALNYLASDKTMMVTYISRIISSYLQQVESVRANANANPQEPGIISGVLAHQVRSSVRSSSSILASLLLTCLDFQGCSTVLQQAWPYLYNLTDGLSLHAVLASTPSLTECNIGTGTVRDKLDEEILAYFSNTNFTTQEFMVILPAFDLLNRCKDNKTDAITDICNKVLSKIREKNPSEEIVSLTNISNNFIFKEEGTIKLLNQFVTLIQHTTRMLNVIDLLSGRDPKQGTKLGLQLLHALGKKLDSSNDSKCKIEYWLDQATLIDDIHTLTYKCSQEMITSFIEIDCNYNEIDNSNDGDINTVEDSNTLVNTDNNTSWITENNHLTSITEKPVSPINQDINLSLKTDNAFVDNSENQDINLSLKTDNAFVDNSENQDINLSLKTDNAFVDNSENQKSDMITTQLEETNPEHINQSENYFVVEPKVITEVTINDQFDVKQVSSNNISLESIAEDSKLSINENSNDIIKSLDIEENEIDSVLISPMDNPKNYEMKSNEFDSTQSPDHFSSIKDDISQHSNLSSERGTTTMNLISYCDSDLLSTTKTDDIANICDNSEKSFDKENNCSDIKDHKINKTAIATQAISNNSSESEHVEGKTCLSDEEAQTSNSFNFSTIQERVEFLHSFTPELSYPVDYDMLVFNGPLPICLHEDISKAKDTYLEPILYECLAVSLDIALSISDVNSKDEQLDKFSTHLSSIKHISPTSYGMLVECILNSSRATPLRNKQLYGVRRCIPLYYRPDMKNSIFQKGEKCLELIEIGRTLAKGIKELEPNTLSMYPLVIESVIKLAVKEHPEITPQYFTEMLDECFNSCETDLSTFHSLCRAIRQEKLNHPNNSVLASINLDSY